jgi:DASH complex subunit ASK1
MESILRQSGKDRRCALTLHHATHDTDSCQFWKQFFEASANVSLSGYEAPQDDSLAQDDTQQEETYEDEETMTGDAIRGGATTPQRAASSHGEMEDTMTLDSPSMGHSTPGMPQSLRKGKYGDGDELDADEEAPQFAGLSSPYETLREEFEGGPTGSRTPKFDPVTPGKSQALPDMMGFDSSPFVQPTTSKKPHLNQDPLMHRVLDKTFRVQATPLISPRKYKPTGAFTPGTANRAAPTPRGATVNPRLPKWDDSSPPSSPAPQLRADIFSPMKTPRTPGISVQTPAKGKTPMSVGRNDDYVDYSDDDELDFSPPKTIQFHIPQTKLLQTPGTCKTATCSTSTNVATAREASRRIVDDLLMTAGGDFTESGMEDDSPSVVRRQIDLDDSF